MIVLLPNKLYWIPVPSATFSCLDIDFILFSCASAHQINCAFCIISYLWFVSVRQRNMEQVLSLADSEFVRGMAKAASSALASEIGDKTFFIAALMAAKHPRL